jgi:hypothetical protein
MKVVQRKSMIVITLFILGLLVAMNWTPSNAMNKGVVSPVGIPENLASANTGIELVTSVDWVKVRQEPMSPTF